MVEVHHFHFDGRPDPRTYVVEPWVADAACLSDCDWVLGLEGTLSGTPGDGRR